VHSYIVESEFYKVYSQQCIEAGINVPRSYYTDCDKSGKVVLVMSDLRDTYLIASGGGMYWPKFIAAVDWLARFHALHWDCTGIESGKLWPEGCYWRLDTRMEEYENMGPNWKRLKGAAHSIADLLKHGTQQGDELPTRNRTFVHGDFKSANLQFANISSTATKSGSISSHDSFECAVVDFQYVGAGYGVRDLVMLFVSSYDMPRQYQMAVQTERDMLRLYHDKLMYYIDLYSSNQGTSKSCDYGLEELTKHYELSLLDYVRFMAGWGMWGNSEYAEQRAMELLTCIDGGKCLRSEEYEQRVRRMYMS
jgi:aminoglycoside/choline kinase family phosphotransferase